MKSISIIFFITVTISLNAKSFEGIVYLKSNDTLYCNIIHNDLHGNNWRDHILSKKFIKIEQNGEKLKIPPQEIIKYSINYNDSWKTYWTIKTEKEILFMEKIIDGNASLYRCMTYAPLNYQYYSHYVIVKKEHENQLYIRMGTFGIKKKLLTFFKDCSKIKEAINRKEVRPGKMGHDEIVVKLYNNTCT